MPFILLVTAAFILFPVIMIPINFLLMNAVNGKAKYYFLFLFAMGVGMFGIHFMPDGPYDIVRYIYNLETLRLISNPLVLLNSEAVKSYGYTIGLDTNVLFNIYSWIISKFQNDSLFSFFSMVISYVTFLFPVISTKNDFVIKIFTALLVVTSIPLVITISAVRWPIAAGLFISLQYIYFAKLNSRKYIWIFLIPVLFHSSMIIVVAPSFLIAFFDIRTVKVAMLSVVGMMALFPLALFYAQKSTIPYVTKLLQKFTDYSATPLGKGFWLDNGALVVSIVWVVFFFYVLHKMEIGTIYRKKHYILVVMISLLTYVGLYMFNRPLTPRFNWIIPMLALAGFNVVSGEKLKIGLFGWVLITTGFLSILANNYTQFLQGFLSQAIRLQNPDVWTDTFIKAIAGYGG